ncbi:MAG: molybdopterin-dependent oxidoreductase [Thermoanaerobaculia bacterium]|nr:molybdopterin-dependent oxidoreductase [Thermoanaerobaculia bacterium]
MSDDPKRPDHVEEDAESPDTSGPCPGDDEETVENESTTTDPPREPDDQPDDGPKASTEDEVEQEESRKADEVVEVTRDESDSGDLPAEGAEPATEDEDFDDRLRRLSRRGFLTMAVAAGAGYAGWRWLESRPRIDRRPWPYRRVLQANEKIARAYYDRERLSPTFPPSEIDPLRPNGRLGLDPDQNAGGWMVTIHGVAGANGPVEVPLSEIHSLPGYEMITELRCIEGWTAVNRWTGTQLLELMKRYPPATRDGSPPDMIRRPERLVRYVSMETPGRGYYVGLDMASAVHPQTTLVWAMNDEPIDWRHGAPLRLAIPVKYGIKNIKRIATIRYTDQRPDDYWAKRGYDWYAGF